MAHPTASASGSVRSGLNHFLGDVGGGIPAAVSPRSTQSRLIDELGGQAERMLVRMAVMRKVIASFRCRSAKPSDDETDRLPRVWLR